MNSQTFSAIPLDNGLISYEKEELVETQQS